MDATAKLMTTLIKSFLDDEKLNIESLSLNESQSLFNLSKFHDISHLVGYVLTKNEVKMPTEIKEKFKHSQSVAVYRYEQLNYDFNILCDSLENAKIDFLPMKGAVIRPLYTEPWLRLSCDIDILVAKNDVERAKEVILTLGYKYELSTGNEVAFFSQSGVCLELHFELIESGTLDKGVDILKNAWKYASSEVQNSYKKVFTNEMLYFYHIVHLAKHYMYGGCGVKPFIDLYLINKNLTFDIQKKNDLLEQGGLKTFAEQVEYLAKVWFEEKEHTDLTRKMEIYILNGGVYGCKPNMVAIQQARHGGTKQYYKSRIFLPYKQLKSQYPKLEKHKWLLPFYQVKRWFRVFKKGKVKEWSKEIKTVNNIQESHSMELQQMLKNLNLI